MKTYQATLKSASPYTSSRQHSTPKLERETNDDHERRTWREKLTTDSNGNAVFPAMGFKFALTSAAKQYGGQVPGQGKKTYTKPFESGILITESPSILIPTKDGSNWAQINKADVNGHWQSVNSDGRRGSGSRVMRCFPIVHEWKCVLTIYVLDELITAKVLRKAMEDAGRFIGIGQFRAERGGTNGRFEVLELKEV